MKYRITVNKKIIPAAILSFLLLPFTVNAQNRGNALGFQGLVDYQRASVRATAMGSAFNAISSDLNSLYYNPAGLSGLEKITVSVSGNTITRTWTENQEYRPNRRLVTLPFYLEGLYIPDPVNNGMWDHEVFAEALLDTSYLVALPDTGLTAYSKEAADWEAAMHKTGISELTIAYPFTLFNRNISVALGVQPQIAIHDYDRNKTYLDPHIAYSEYNIIPQANGTDTVRMNWYDYIRERKGSALAVDFGFGMEILPWLSWGFSLEFLSGKSSDSQSKEKTGYFDIYDENMFMFSYDTLHTLYQGTSRFSALKSGIALLIEREFISVGLNINLPYSIKRTFSYVKTVTDTAAAVSIDVIGEESVKIPAGFDLGFAMRPIDKFTVTIDISQTAYHNAAWSFDSALEEAQREWVKQEVLAFGAEINPIAGLFLRAGYRSATQVFVPDGAAIRTKGPQKTTWSLGGGYNLGKYGEIDIAYLIGNLKYYDQYFSNINYVNDKSGRLIIGYSIGL